MAHRLVAMGEVEEARQLVREIEALIENPEDYLALVPVWLATGQEQRAIQEVKKSFADNGENLRNLAFLDRQTEVMKLPAVLAEYGHPDLGLRLAGILYAEGYYQYNMVPLALLEKALREKGYEITQDDLTYFENQE